MGKMYNSNRTLTKHNIGFIYLQTIKAQVKSLEFCKGGYRYAIND